MTIVIRPLTTPTPHKLAEAELAFDAADGLLNGLVLRGIGIWESTERPGEIIVSLPTRHFRGRDGVQRTYPLLRNQRNRKATQLLRNYIIGSYLKAQVQQEIATNTPSCLVATVTAWPVPRPQE